MISRAVHARGATLIELVVTIAIVSVVLGGLLLGVAEITRRSADPLIEEQAVAVAQAHLEEVLFKSFCDPDLDVDADPGTPLDCPRDCSAAVCGSCRGTGASTESARPLYDDICDYDGFDVTGVRDQTATVIPGLEQYRVRIEVIDAGVSLEAAAADAGAAALVNVTVSHAALAAPVVVSAFKANY